MTDDLGWLSSGASGAAAEPVRLAEIYATVELERALEALGESASHAAAAVDEPLLGARVVRLESGVALAEPSTEGRLAATLARHGEGRAGRYLEVPVPLKDVARRAAAAGVSVSRPAPGPFGREVLVLGGPVSGPHTLLVERRTVPSPR
ncbi:MAG TPA: hypothetical protein VFR93_08425 [Candidatus Limnocylindrales bacterium]|nr:hypothetical protein [Candidatus Limnocylindrales bacterium]